jgi:hypothetical protein
VVRAGDEAARQELAGAGAEGRDLVAGDQVEAQGVLGHVVLDAVEVVAQVLAPGGRGEAGQADGVAVEGGAAEGDRDGAGGLAREPCPFGHVGGAGAVVLGGEAAAEAEGAQAGRKPSGVGTVASQPCSSQA